MSQSKNKVQRDYTGYRGHTQSKLARVHSKRWGKLILKSIRLFDRDPTALAVQSVRIQAHRYKKSILVPKIPFGRVTFSLAQVLSVLVRVCFQEIRG